jgi:predicted class III extradiol MEMO1 family dioxygenase
MLASQCIYLLTIAMIAAQSLCILGCRSRVIILGPSHHFYTRRCCLSPATHFDTPLGASLAIWQDVMLIRWLSRDSGISGDGRCAGSVSLSAEVYRELEATGEFDIIDMEADEVMEKFKALLQKPSAYLGLWHEVGM